MCKYSIWTIHELYISHGHIKLQITVSWRKSAEDVNTYNNIKK